MISSMSPAWRLNTNCKPVVDTIMFYRNRRSPVLWMMGRMVEGMVYIGSKERTPSPPDMHVVPLYNSPLDIGLNILVLSEIIY